MLHTPPNWCESFMWIFDGRHSWVSITLFIPWCVGLHYFGPCGIVLRMMDDSLWNSCDLTEFLLALHFLCELDLKKKNHHYVTAFFCFSVGGCFPWGWSNTLILKGTGGEQEMEQMAWCGQHEDEGSKMTIYISTCRISKHHIMSLS